MLALLFTLVTVAILLLAGMVLLWRRLLQARQQRDEARARLHDTIEALPASVEIFDAEDRMIAYNRQLLDVVPHLADVLDKRLSFVEMLKLSIERGGVLGVTPEDTEWLAQRLSSRGNTNSPMLQHVRGNRWMRVHERRTASGGIVGVRLDVTDLILEQQRLTASQAHLEALIKAATSGILTLEESGHIIEANPACEHLFGYESGQLRGSHLSLLINDLSNGPLQASSAEHTARHRAGHELSVQLALAEVRTPTTHHFVAIVTDFSERRRQEVRLRQANELLARQAVTDGLTGVGNRRLFDQALLMEWQRGTRSGRSLALLMVDIDHFKQYNDHYGHVAGDDCLRRVASLLAASIGRSGETLCRYGGEEFAVLLIDTDLPGAAVVAQRFLDAMRLAAIEHRASPVAPVVTVSVGVAAQVPQREGSSLQLLERADQALYNAKQGGRARMAVAEPQSRSLAAQAPGPDDTPR